MKKAVVSLTALSLMSITAAPFPASAAPAYEQQLCKGGKSKLLNSPALRGKWKDGRDKKRGGMAFTFFFPSGIPASGKGKAHYVYPAYKPWNISPGICSDAKDVIVKRDGSLEIVLNPKTSVIMKTSGNKYELLYKTPNFHVPAARLMSLEGAK